MHCTNGVLVMKMSVAIHKNVSFIWLFHQGWDDVDYFIQMYSFGTVYVEFVIITTGIGKLKKKNVQEGKLHWLLAIVMVLLNKKAITNSI